MKMKKLVLLFICAAGVVACGKKNNARIGC